MLEAEFRLPLPDGGSISYKEAFSPFTIYVIRKFQESYILIPKQNQENLQSVVIVATESNIRICQRKGWPRMFVSKIRHLIDCKDQDMLTKINYNSIPSEIQGSIVDNLLKQIQYKSILS